MTIDIKQPRLRINRLVDRPIIHPGLHTSIGENIQGPSLIKVPDWVPGALGRYYLYFADRKGAYIRLAYADELTGPWRIHPPGSLQLEESRFLTQPPLVSDEERASPDVHVDDANRKIVMYFNGLEALAHQTTRVAISGNGVHFSALPDTLGKTYFRVFTWQGMTYALAMPGQLYRADDPLGPFEEGPVLFNPQMRHCAVLQQEKQLWVFWTEVGDAPEHIKLSVVDLRDDWFAWRDGEPLEVLRPEMPWEGSDAKIEPSIRSTAYGRVNQLRDPAVYVEASRIYLLYAVGGESGIALAEVEIL